MRFAPELMPIFLLSPCYLAMPTCQFATYLVSAGRNRYPRRLRCDSRGPQTRRKSRGAQRRAHGVLEQLHDHRRPCAASVLGPALDESLFHDPGEPQGHAKSAAEFERESGVL